MTAVQIALRSNPSKYTYSGNARLLNAYAEKQGEDGKEPFAVLPAPGMVECCEVTDTPNRGAIYLDDLDAAYVIYSSGAYKVVKASDNPLTLTALRIGTVPGNDQVQMSRNQADPPQISIHCALGEFYIEEDVVKHITDDDITDETVVTQDNAGGYTVYGASSGKFIISAINDCADADGLDFATAEQSADRLVKAKSHGGDLFLFGSQTVEPWRNTGNADFPFDLIGGGTVPVGLVAPLAVLQLDESLMWPGDNNTIYRMNGYQPLRISTHYVERLFEGDTSRESVAGFSFAFEGHAFASWTGTNYTVCYDAATKFWHDRQSWNLSTWRARNGFRAWGKTIVGDALSGKLFYLDKDTFTEDSDPLIWGVDTAFLNAFPNGGIVDALHIDIATGVGTVLASSQGFDPILMLSWSVDGGKTFKGNRQLKLGARGQYVTLKTRRLGRFGPQGIQFRLRVSDPVIRSIIAIDAKVRPLKK